MVIIAAAPFLDVDAPLEQSYVAFVTSFLDRFHNYDGRGCNCPEPERRILPMIDDSVNSSPERRKYVNNDTNSRLIQALGDLWEDHSHAEISVRMVATRAKASVSAIDYHFGSLEHLFVRAQDEAIAKANKWMSSLANDLSSLGRAGMAPASRAALVAAIIDEWTQQQRPLALAWREAQAAARGRTNIDGPHRRWMDLWRSFWTALCTDLGLSRLAEPIALFFDGEAGQHLIEWRRPLDRAMLDETTRALFAFLCHKDATPVSDIREAYQRLAESEYDLASSSGWNGSPYDDAAGALLSEEGLAGLTFRAVAKRAGATLGTVAYHFGSKTNLAQRALRHVYESSTGQTVHDIIEVLPASPDAMLEAVIESIVTDNPPVLRAMDEIALHLSRGGDHGAFSATIRCFRDPVGVAVLGRLLADMETPSTSLAAAFSSVVRGYDHYGAALPDEQSSALGHRVLGLFIGRQVVSR